MSAAIQPMGVGGVRHLVDRAYRESSELQFVRELFKNAAEADATRIEFGPEWHGVEVGGVYRLLVADNGSGMDPDRIETFLNTFGGGGKPIGEAHENFGVGVKTSTLPWNQRGLVVMSWTPECPDGCLVWMCRDPKTEEYGARKFLTSSGDYDVVVEPFDDPELGLDWRKVKPSWIGEHGTAVVCLGDSGNQDTFVRKGPSDEVFGVKGISAYLNRRLWEFDPKLEIFVQELRSNRKANWARNYLEASSGNPPPEGEIDRRWNRRRIRGARYYVEQVPHRDGGLDANGSVQLPDGTSVDWYLWSGRRPRVHSYAHDKGYIAALYDNELYDVRSHIGAFRRFGIPQSEVRDMVTLIVRPPRLADGTGVYPDTARNSLKVKGTKRAGEPLPWDEWGEMFAQKLPRPIIEALKAAIPSSSGTISDEKWRERLAERFGRRWKRKTFRTSEGGTASITPTDPGTHSSIIPRSPRAKTSLSGGIGATAGQLTKGSMSGSTSASPSDSAVAIPNYRWVSEADVEPGRAAAWVAPSSADPQGVVLLNRNFTPFVEVLDYWSKLYPEHLAEKVRQVVEQVYGESMVARIAHSESLARNEHWGRKAVDNDLRTPPALTMSALGLINEDTHIAKRLGHLLGGRRRRRSTQPPTINELA